MLRDTLKDSSWASLNVIKYQQIYSISYIEKNFIRFKWLICVFKGGIPLQLARKSLSSKHFRTIFTYNVP